MTAPEPQSLQIRHYYIVSAEENLNLSYACHLHIDLSILSDHFFHLSVSVGSESSRSRLRNMVTLRLSGLDINESTLRLLQRHVPQLERLDLAHCKDITDSSIALLAAVGTHTRNNLTELTLAGGCSSIVMLSFQISDSEKLY